MEWYWWVLIVIGIVWLVGWILLNLGGIGESFAWPIMLLVIIFFILDDAAKKRRRRKYEIEDRGKSRWDGM